MDEEQSHGLSKAVDHPEDAEVPHLLLHVVQLDGGEQERISPDHATAHGVNQSEDGKLPPAHVPVPLLLQHPLGGQDLTGDQRGEDGDEADPEPGPVAGGEECVGGDDVEDHITEVRGQRHHVK